MKKLLALLVPLLLFLFFLENSNAAIRPVSVNDSLELSAPYEQVAKAGNPASVKKERRSHRFFAKLKKWFHKKRKAVLPEARRSLQICLGLLGLTIVLFALSMEIGFLSVVASVTAIGAIVFFALWLVEFTRGRSLTEQQDDGD